MAAVFIEGPEVGPALFGQQFGLLLPPCGDFGVISTH
jgi:hypothetical protein